jgi:hypothetical protein
MSCRLGKIKKNKIGSGSEGNGKPTNGGPKLTCIESKRNEIKHIYYGPSIAIINYARFTENQIKGIDSRKFDILFCYHSKTWKFLHLFYFTVFKKISSFSYRIFEYTTFSGAFLLSHNAVHELCSIAQFVNINVT